MNHQVQSMPPQPPTTQVTQEAIMNLLSNKEVGAISTADNKPSIPENAEFIDLEALGLEVQRARGPQLALGRVLLRTSVRETTWSAILATLAGFPPLVPVEAAQAADDTPPPLMGPMYGPIQAASVSPNTA